MTFEERDKEIFEAIMRAYDVEVHQKDKINAKLNNVIAIAGTIATLNIGIGFFILDRVSLENPFYFHLITTLLSGVGLFVAAILTALLAYRPTTYYMFPRDPQEFIRKYANLTKTHVVRETAMTMAEIVGLNREVNLRKVKRLTCVFLFTILGTIAVVFFAVFMVLALQIPPPQ